MQYSTGRRVATPVVLIANPAGKMTEYYVVVKLLLNEGFVNFPALSFRKQVLFLSLD